MYFAARNKLTKPSNPKLNKQKECNRLSFFQNVKSISGTAVTALGLIFSVAGINEFFGGEKVSLLLAEYKNNLPDIVNSAAKHLDEMTITMKCCGGSSIIAIGLSLMLPKSHKKIRLS
jgi:hypothetical protein